MHIFLRCLKKKNPINQSRFLCCKFSIYWVVVNSGKYLVSTVSHKFNRLENINIIWRALPGIYSHFLIACTMIGNIHFNTSQLHLRILSITLCVLIFFFVLFCVFFISWTQLKTKIVSLSAQKEEMCVSRTCVLEVYSQTCTRSILFGEWFSSWPQWKGRLISRRAS